MDAICRKDVQSADSPRERPLQTRKAHQARPSVAYQNASGHPRPRHHRHGVHRRAGLPMSECKRCGEEFLRSPRSHRRMHCSIKCRFLDILGDNRGSIQDCWEWPGSRHGKGYGHFNLGNKVEKAQRASYEIFRGPIPKGMHACHSCDNPACVNPWHIFLGTNADNLRDRQSKGRQARGSRNSHAKLTEAQTLAIRAHVGQIYDIAQEFSVSKATVRGIKKGRIWRHV